MKNSRLLGFIFFIILGIGIGLLYGWMVSPGDVKNTTLSSLRADYKSDYTLMVSEVYASDPDIEDTINLLEEISPGNPLAAVQNALLVGQQFGYSEIEMRWLANLEMALRDSMGQEQP
jgi:hypothetical protein